METLLESLGRMEFVRCRLLEGTGEAKTLEARSWLKTIEGGGVLLDLAYHYLKPYFALFDFPLKIDKVQLGVHASGCEGRNYSAWSFKGGHAETYAFSSFDSTGGFKVEIEVAKNWTHDCRDILIQGSRGEVLMDFGCSGSRRNILYTNIAGKKGAAIVSQNYWDLVTQGFVSYCSSMRTEPHNFREGKSALQTIFAIKAYT